jgi:hypothetical protein
MTDPFALLGLPRSPHLDPGDVDRAWRDLNREAQGGASDEAAALNEARARLLDPVSRLAAWLDLVDPGGEPERGISPDLMELFARIGPILASTDSLLARHRQASTAIARALLAKEAVAAQLAVQGLLQEIQPLKNALIDRFPEFGATAATGRWVEARRALGQLKFLKRWEEQCQQRLLALLAT